MPNPDIDVLQNCVESGHEAFPGSDVALVDFDNPRIWTKVEFSGVSTKWNGTMKQELFTAPEGWRCANCDLTMEVFGGNGPATQREPRFSNNVSGSRQSLSESPLLWSPQRPGHWGVTGAHQLSLISQGYRTGHVRLDNQLFITLPSGTS